MKYKYLCFIIILMGLCYDIALILSLEKSYPEETSISFCCEIISEKESKNYNDKYLVKNKLNQKMILYLKKEKEYFPGDVIKVEGRFEKGEKSRNYKGFDYRRYLKQNKIYGIVFSEKTEYIKTKKDMYFIFAKIRSLFFEKIDSLYEEKYAGFLKGLLLGNKNYLDKEIENNFKIANISHILAISGLHISFIAQKINTLLKKLINSKLLRCTILIILLILFLILTGNSVSCIRACIMNIFIILSSCFQRKNSFWNTFIISFIFILFINPYNIFNVGMWLSYMGTAGIVLFYDFLYKIFSRKYGKNILLESLLISCSAQILIFPIMMYVFNSISTTFFITNIVISIIIEYVLAIGYISVFLPFSKLTSAVEKLLIDIVFETANIASKISFSRIYIVTPSLLLIIAYYFLVLYMVLYFKTKKFHILKLILSKKIVKLLKKETKRILVVFLIISLITNINRINFELKIYFLDVGQGDCTLIITPLGKRIIIDGGEGNSDKYDCGENVVFPYLLDRGIKHIDYLIISHCDSDHVGGLIYLLKNVKTEKILIGAQTSKTKQLEDLIEIANTKKIKIISLKKGDTIKVEKNIKIDVLWPDAKNIIEENKINNNSLVFKLTYKNFDMLFTGDIEKIAEKELLIEENLLKSKILKVAHHGSKTSSTEEFLKLVKPEVALIGVEKNNKFGHPSDITLSNLNNLNCRIYRTDINGEISISTNGKKYKILTKIK